MLGAFFGDAFCKDLLTPRQRLAAFTLALALAMSPLAGRAAMKDGTGIPGPAASPGPWPCC